MYSAHRRQAVGADAFNLAPRLRPLDLREIAGMSGQRPVDALQRCIRLSDAPQTIVVDALPVALFGVAPLPSGVGGAPWFLCSPEVSQVRLRLIREGRAWVEKMAEKYGILQNYCLQEHEESLTFLDSLDFTFTRVVSFHDLNWVEFERRHNV